MKYGKSSLTSSVVLAGPGAYCNAVTNDGWRWIVDAHRDDRRYIIQSDELLTAFLELEAMLL
jgi:hypothetical protein